MPEIALDDLRALIREEIRQPRKRRNDPRRAIQCQMTPDEFAAVRDCAAAKGMSVADLIRLALEPVVSREFPRNRTVPINLIMGQQARKEALQADARRGLIASRLLARETDAAVGQAASVPVPKLRGPQRPEKPVPKG